MTGYGLLQHAPGLTARRDPRQLRNHSTHSPTSGTVQRRLHTAQLPHTRPTSRHHLAPPFRDDNLETADAIKERRYAAKQVDAPPAPAGQALPEAPVHPPSWDVVPPMGLHAGHPHIHIDELRKKPHSFCSSEPSTSGGNIVVALDDTDNAAAAVEWVAKHLYHPGSDELRVVHVVCDPRGLQGVTSIGTSNSGRPITMGSMDVMGPGGVCVEQGGAPELALQDYLGRLNEAASRVVERRCAALKQLKLPYETELPRLPALRSAAGIAQALLEAAQRCDAWLLVVANHGPGALAEYGSVSRYCYQHSPLPLLLIPSPESAAAAAEEWSRAHAEDAMAVPAGVPPPSFPLTPTSHDSEILLVVNHLEELAQVWQWVADNCVMKGNAVHMWHVAGPSSSGMPSLPTAIANQMRQRGVGAVTYSQLYSEAGDVEDMGQQVCARAADPRVKMVVSLNYSRRGLVQEALQGSIASHLSRHCTKPLLLLQLPE